ncbi:MAG: AAA family ATPase [Bacteroidales bacterium]|nr:AAA family ATPase [Bacteroidales bacterium]
MDTLFKKHRILISQVSTDIIRDITNTIAWQKSLVAIKGSRGVGKTTLIRQYIKKTYGVNPGEALYCALDSLYFSNHSLLDLAERFYQIGGKHLFLDEVHKYPTWSKEIKELNDLYPKLKITFSGSSLIQILNADADLSRRVLSYTMEGLSFREYLLFYKGIKLPKYKLEDILNNADDICEKVNSVCKPQKMFEEYLKFGFYPFYDGNEIEYYSRLENVIEFIIDQEITQFCGIDQAYTRKIKALIMFLANNVPFDVNIAKLSTYLEINKQTTLHYLSALNRAQIINLIYSNNKSVSKLQKPDKILIQNSNFLYTLTNNPNIGTIRECFAVNQLIEKHEVEYGKELGDFKIDGKITFEVGGSDKTFEQIANIPNSYILADNIEYPIGKKLPLWIIGFLY